MFRSELEAAATGGRSDSPLPLLELPFREIWAVDFEFIADPGENPKPVCLVAWELRNGRKLRLWQDQLGPTPPYGTGPDTLFIAYYASAEIGCHLSLGWPIPERVLDLFTEFRNLTNGLRPPSGSGQNRCPRLPRSAGDRR
jgi:DNA polymerase-1